MKKHNPSHEQLAKSQSRRTNALMVRLLEKFEDAFPDLERTHQGQVYKGTIKAMCNDVIRAARDELNDYVLDYRPLHLTEHNTLAMSRTFSGSDPRTARATSVPGGGASAGQGARSFITTTYVPIAL